MAKKGKTPVKAAEPQAQPRTGVAKTFWIEPDLFDAFIRYIDSLEVKQKHTAVLNAALKQFLAKEKFWPPAKE